jgi:hypothetical protein
MSLAQPFTSSIVGIYEVCIGLPNLETAIEYWEQFGYCVETEGKLSTTIAHALYYVNSSLCSVRLQHQTTDHGLIRLMQWDQPQNEGLGLESMK